MRDLIKESSETGCFSETDESRAIKSALATSNNDTTNLNISDQIKISLINQFMESQHWGENGYILIGYVENFDSLVNWKRHIADGVDTRGLIMINYSFEFLEKLEQQRKAKQQVQTSKVSDVVPSMGSGGVDGIDKRKAIYDTYSGNMKRVLEQFQNSGRGWEVNVSEAGTDEENFNLILEKVKAAVLDSEK